MYWTLPTCLQSYGLSSRAQRVLDIQILYTCMLPARGGGS